MGSDRSRRLVLAFAAAHRFLLVSHVHALLADTAADPATVLDALARERLLRAVPQPGGAGWWQITRAGLREARSRLPVPRDRPAQAAHDAGLVWLHLAARRGAFGPLDAIVTEREMRAHDRRSDRIANRIGVVRGGVDDGGRLSLHYPDLLLVDRRGRRIALELELSGKSRRAREEVFVAYATAREIDVVLYLVRTPSMATVVRRTAREFGIEGRVVVQYVRFPADPEPRPSTPRPATRRDGRVGAEAAR